MDKIILDTDPGVDDGMAIQLALNSPELEILGLTTVFGNASVDRTTINALRLLEIANRTEIPVCKGAAKPLERKFRGGVPNVHGEDGQGNIWHSPGRLSPYPRLAYEFMAEKIKSFPNEITIVAIGPLTNLAILLKENEGISKLVKEIVFMGGNAFCSGNATPVAEANVLSDPEAADIVLGADWKVNMVGLDVTHKVLMQSAQLDRIAKNKNRLNRYVSSTFHFYRNFFKEVNKIDGIYVHDSTALVYLLKRELFKIKSYPIRVEATNSISLGKTWPSIGESDHEQGEELFPWRNRPKIDICLSVDSDTVLKIIEERLTGKVV